MIRTPIVDLDFFSTERNPYSLAVIAFCHMFGLFVGFFVDIVGN